MNGKRESYLPKLPHSSDMGVGCSTEVTNACGGNELPTVCLRCVKVNSRSKEDTEGRFAKGGTVVGVNDGEVG